MVRSLFLSVRIIYLLEMLMEKVIPVHDHRRRARGRFRCYNPHPRSAAVPASRNHNHWQFYIVCAVADRARGDGAAVVRRPGECEFELPELCHEHVVVGEYSRSAGVVDSEHYLYVRPHIINNYLLPLMKS